MSDPVYYVSPQPAIREPVPTASSPFNVGSDSDLDYYFNLIRQNTNYNNSWSAQQAQKQMNFQRSERLESEAYNSAEAQINRNWQEYMSNSAHQREIADLKAAGLNPILSVTGGNGAPVTSGATAAGSHAGSGAQGNGDQSGNSALVGVLSGFLNAFVNLEGQRVSAETNLAVADKYNAMSELLGRMSNELGYDELAYKYSSFDQDLAWKYFNTNKSSETSKFIANQSNLTNKEIAYLNSDTSKQIAKLYNATNKEINQANIDNSTALKNMDLAYQYWNSDESRSWSFMEHLNNLQYYYANLRSTREIADNDLEYKYWQTLQNLSAEYYKADLNADTQMWKTIQELEHDTFIHENYPSNLYQAISAIIGALTNDSPASSVSSLGSDLKMILSGWLPNADGSYQNFSNMYIPGGTYHSDSGFSGSSGKFGKGSSKSASRR